MFLNKRLIPPIERRREKNIEFIKQISIAEGIALMHDDDIRKPIFNKDLIECQCCHIIATTCFVETNDTYGQSVNFYAERPAGITEKYKTDKLILMTLDHIIPKIKLNENIDNNHQVLCYTCNAAKNDSLITASQLKSVVSLSVPIHYNIKATDKIDLILKELKANCEKLEIKINSLKSNIDRMSIENVIKYKDIVPKLELELKELKLNYINERIKLQREIAT